MDEDRGTGEDERGDALRPRSGPHAAEDRPAADHDPETVPWSVRRRLDSCASDWLRERAGLPTRRSRAAWIAASLFLALALAGWWPRLAEWAALGGASRIGQLSAELSCEHLLASGSPALRHWRWSAQAGSAPGVEGDVVWDGERHAGYLRFTGLEPNVPSRHQYQLWIVDATRDERYPVDGGVFDLPDTPGTVVVPVHSAIPVREPAAFLVTVEKPGGAVVSGRERIVAVAVPGNPVPGTD